MITHGNTIDQRILLEIRDLVATSSITSIDRAGLLTSLVEKIDQLERRIENLESV